MSGTFGARLADAVVGHGTLCVGIDPHPGLLAAWDLADDARGVAAFADACVEGLAGQVSTVKPQSAFFERHGSAGIAVLERLLADLRGTGTLTVLDAKRSDIGSTMDGYADAYLAPDAPLGADAVTLSPYLGFESLRPALIAAAGAGRGVFVLARTSNPEGAGVQVAVPPDGPPSVAQRIVDAAGVENAIRAGGAVAGMSRAGSAVAGGAVAGRSVCRGQGAPSGSVGVVVGATAAHGLDLAELNGPVLAPGLGAQGATPADVAARFGSDVLVLPAAARAVLAAGPDPAALRDAARSLADQVTGAFAQTAGV